MQISTRTTASFVIMVMLVATLAFVPSTSEAIGPLGFEIEGQGSTPWSFDGIAPGDKGTVPVTLINNGAEEAWATVWVTNIVETDRGGDGAWLAHYMLFGMRSTYIYTDMAMPVNVYDLPSAAEDSTLFIGPIAPGGSAEIYWDWEFLDNDKPQNEAQGDGLRFDISYQLMSSPPSITSNITFDILGRKTVVPIDATGAVLQDVTVAGPGGDVRLFIEKGTRIISDDGTRPTLVEMYLLGSDDTSPLPNNFTRLGDVYEMVASADGRTTDVKVNGNVTLTVRMDPFALPDETRSIALFESSDGGWIRADGQNTNSWEARGLLSEFGHYAVGISSTAEPGIPFFMALDANAAPVVDNYWLWPFIFFKITGESALVEVQLVNVGDVGGTCVIVAELNGRFATDKELMLDVGENAMVVLRVDDIFGDGNDLSVVGQSFNMSRVVWINWLLIICIIVIVAAAAYARHRYKEKKTDQER